MFLFCLVFAMFCARLFICASWSPAGKGLTSWLSFVVSSVSLSLSHWYPGSGVLLDCIDSWSLQPYLLRCTINRSHSTPCKKAGFEHLQIFSRTLLGLFSVCEWQDLSFTYQKSEKTTYLDNLVFSALSVLWGTVKKSGLKSDPRQTLPGECAGESVTK